MLLGALGIATRNKKLLGAQVTDWPRAKGWSPFTWSLAGVRRWSCSAPIGRLAPWTFQCSVLLLLVAMRNNFIGRVKPKSRPSRLVRLHWLWGRSDPVELYTLGFRIKNAEIGSFRMLEKSKLFSRFHISGIGLDCGVQAAKAKSRERQQYLEKAQQERMYRVWDFCWNSDC